jgi:hypothetical protein
MNWQSIFSDKLKVASILALLMGGIILSNIFEKRMLENNRKSIESIYEDRLQPATDLFEMRQLIANRVYILEQIVDKKQYSDEILKEELKQIDVRFNILMERYEKTYLVPEEKAFISILKADILKLDQLSKGLVNSENSLTAENLAKLKPLSDEVNKDLSELSKMQSKIGQEILTAYSKDISIGNVLNSLQIILSIIIGVIVFMLFSNRRVTLIKVKKHNLN